MFSILLQLFLLIVDLVNLFLGTVIDLVVYVFSIITTILWNINNSLCIYKQPKSEASNYTSDHSYTVHRSWIEQAIKLENICSSRTTCFI